MTRRLMQATPKRLLFVGAALLLGYFAWTLLTGPGHRITWEGYQLIEGGMTEEEVSQLLGVRAGDHTTQPVHYPPFGEALPCTTYGSAEKWKTALEWKGDYHLISVGLDEDGKVILKSYKPLWPHRRSFIEKIRTWLKM